MKKSSLSPAQSLTLGFTFLTLLGAFLLTLPLSSSKGQFTPVIDALFTASSAITTTGLVVVDTGSYYSLFGQLVILGLIQIGGLGYMIFIALIVLGLGRKLSLSNRILLHESIARPTSLDIKKFVKVVILFTLLFELAGAVGYFLVWKNQFPLPHAAYSAIFHSISGFCTAGFGLYSDSFMAWRDSVYLNFLANIISIGGAIGFFVLYDIYVLMKRLVRGEKTLGLLAYSRFVICMTIILFGTGSAVIFFAEPWGVEVSLQQRLLYSIFQSVATSTTTGFNTIDIGSMTMVSLFFLIIMMFIGASPGSTGGGIKTTTFGLVMLFIRAFLKGEENVQIFFRRVSYVVMNRAFAIVSIALLWVISVSLVLCVTEQASLLQILFEVSSALSGTGLSTGITSSLSVIGKILISITMLAGRIGPIAIGYSLLGRVKPAAYKYAKAEILVG